MFGLNDSPRRQIERLAEGFGLRLVALTRRAEGRLFFREGHWSEQTSHSVQVVDTVGAGDAFAAALVRGLWLEMELEELHTAAAEVARHVRSCAGAKRTKILHAVPLTLRTAAQIAAGIDGAATEPQTSPFRSNSRFTNAGPMGAGSSTSNSTASTPSLELLEEPCACVGERRFIFKRLSAPSLRTVRPWSKAHKQPGHKWNQSRSRLEERPMQQSCCCFASEGLVSPFSQR